MLYLIILIIALGWAGWFWAWGRDRYTSRSGLSQSGLGLPPSPFAPQPAAPLSAPRTPARAKRRRREVLGGLATATLLAFLIARAWAPMYVIVVVLLGAFVAYGRAVYVLERGPLPQVSGSDLRARLAPVVDDQRPAARPGPTPSDVHLS